MKMSKELEELKGITRNKIEYIKKQPKIDLVYLKYYEDVLNLVNRIESIDNAEYSKALKCLKILGEYELKQEYLVKYLMVYDTINQYLLKSQKQEKVLEIIKKITNSGDTLQDIIDCKTYNEYMLFSWDCLITQEEFDTLKRWNKND